MIDKITFIESRIANLEALVDMAKQNNKPVQDWIIYKLGELKSELEAEKKK